MRSGRTVLYMLATAAFIGVGWWLHSGLVAMEVAAVLRALRWLLLVGVALISGGVLLRRGADAVFLDTVGGVALLAWLILFVLYGGMEDAAVSGTDTACNLLMLLWTALPIGFLVRTLVLAAGNREDAKPRRLVWWLTGALVAWLLVLFAIGSMLHFVHGEEETKQDTGIDAWIGEK